MTKQEGLSETKYCSNQFVDRAVDGVIIPGAWRDEVNNTNALQSNWKMLRST